MGTDRTAFISHASEDAAVAYELCSHLEQAGVACWIAPRDVTPGNDYGSEIIHGIEACPVFVLLPEAEYGRLQDEWKLPALAAAEPRP